MRLAVALVLLLLEARASAQACCTTTGALFPARLQGNENGLVGVAASVAGTYGAFDSSRALQGQPAGVGETDLQQTVLVTARLLDDVQVNVAVPIVETWRVAPGTSAIGGGVGDMSLSARWDVLRAGRSHAPGIAPIASLTVPSGRPAELAREPLAVDATGTGAAQVGVGVSLEQLFGRTLLAASATTLLHGARTVAGVHSQLGPALAVTLGASYVIGRHGVALAGSLMYMESLDATVAGADVPGSARALTQLTLSLAVPMPWGRVLGAITLVPPFAGLAQNELGTVGGTLTFVYGFKSGICRPP